MSSVAITNLVMIQDPKTEKVLVQNRVLSWKGPAFPGGHVEADESFYDSAVREVKEETGLEVRNLKSCGVVNYVGHEKWDRYLVFLYKTSDFSGQLLPSTYEGENSWMTLAQLREAPTENRLLQYLSLFLDDTYSEAFAVKNEQNQWEFTFK